ncbi:hypothetical protein FGADI_5544 [Fusarium gaditjirri]|uniref:Uncharacterized protein n=1 Tax=Fusarium gaditjirri TaxID=282569 RepID=A0A8H4T9W0_9HYPO|nr:hypothetical protein FGADI_5544 [Fusarium gaditjirri]
MDQQSIEQMNISMLISMVRIMLHIIQDQNVTIEALRRQVQDLAAQVYQMRSEIAQLRAGSEAVEEGPQTPDTLLHSLEVTYQLPDDEAQDQNQL